MRKGKQIVDNEQIIQWARDAGCQIMDIPGIGLVAKYNAQSVTNLIARVADIVAAATREECAKVCDRLNEKAKIYTDVAGICAKEIRALNN